MQGQLLLSTPHTESEIEIAVKTVTQAHSLNTYLTTLLTEFLDSLPNSDSDPAAVIQSGHGLANSFSSLSPPNVIPFRFMPGHPRSLEMPRYLACLDFPQTVGPRIVTRLSNDMREICDRLADIFFPKPTFR